MILEYFGAIFAFPNPQGIPEFVRAIPRKVDDEANSDLCKLVYDEEIKKVGFFLCRLKAPREKMFVQPLRTFS